MPDLLVLEDIVHLEYVLERHPAWLERMRPATADLAVAARLEDLGIPFADEWAFLTGDDTARNRDRVYELLDNWCGDSAAGLRYRGLSLASAARMELRDPFETCLNARTIYGRLLEATRPGRIHGFFFDSVPLRRTGPAPFARVTLALGQTVLRMLARQRGVAVRSLRCPLPLSREARDATQPSGVLAEPIPGAHTCRGWIVPEVPGHVAWDGPPPDLDRLRDARQVLLLLENVQNPRELTELEREFVSRPDWFVARLVASEQTPFVSWPWHLRPLMRQLHAARRSFEAFCDAYRGPDPEIFANPAMHRQFRSIWQDLLRGVELAESFANVLDLLRPDAILHGYASFILERLLVRTAVEMGVPTVGLLHGGLNPTIDPRPLEGDESCQLVWGEGDVEVLSRIRPREALRCVGSPRYWRQHQEWTARRGEAPRGCPAARQSLGLRPDRPVVLLITTAINGGLALINADATRHRAAWRELVALARQRQDLTFVVKPHPSFDSYSFYRWLCRDGPPNLVIFWEEYLSAVLPAADVAVLVSACTTGAIEAMLHGLPVVFWRAARYHTWLHHDRLEKRGAISVGSVLELEATVDRLLHDDGFRREAVLDAAPALTETLGTVGAAGPARILEELEQIAGTAKPPARLELERFHEGLLEELVRALPRRSEPGLFEATLNRALAALSSVPDRASIRGLLFRLSVSLGRGIDDSEELLSLLEQSYAAARRHLRLTPRDQRGMLLNACLTSLTWHAYPAGSPHTARLVAEVLRLEPRAILCCPRAVEFLQQAGKTPGTERPMRDRIRALERELAALRGSWTWKVGRAVVAPLSGVKGLLRRRPA